ncbi:MAG: DsbA family oxidoreductase [Actinomycetota bacterium]
MTTPVTVWVDPGCPWAWQTVIWLRDLAADGLVRLDWKSFSLELNASEPETPFWEACTRQGASLVSLALAHREGGNGAYERLFVALGRRLHTDGEPMSDGLLREAAAEAGMPDVADRARAMPELADEVRRAYVEARELDVFGVPTLQIGDAKTIYGPIIARAPEGAESLQLWEHTRWLAERPDLFELKRWPRDIRPGEREPSAGTTA